MRPAKRLQTQAGGLAQLGRGCMWVAARSLPKSFDACTSLP